VAAGASRPLGAPASGTRPRAVYPRRGGRGALCVRHARRPGDRSRASLRPPPPSKAATAGPNCGDRGGPQGGRQCRDRTRRPRGRRAARGPTGHRPPGARPARRRRPSWAAALRRPSWAAAAPGAAAAAARRGRRWTPRPLRAAPDRRRSRSRRARPGPEDLGQARQRAALHRLEALAQLARDRRRPLGSAGGGEVGQGREAERRLVERGGVVARGDGREAFAPLAPLPRQEALEGEAVDLRPESTRAGTKAVGPGSASTRTPRSSARRTRSAPGSLMPGVPASVTYATCRCAAQDAARRARRSCGRRAAPWGSRCRAGGAGARAARVLGRHDVGGAERREGAQRDVVEVPDRRRDQRERWPARGRSGTGRRLTRTGASSGHHGDPAAPAAAPARVAPQRGAQRRAPELRLADRHRHDRALRAGARLPRAPPALLEPTLGTRARVLPFTRDRRLRGPS
jgi:hypothetical protein